MVSFSIKDIRAAVSHSAFEKAKVYAREGRVLEYEMKDGHISGLTQGDARRPYVQKIRIEAQPSGRVDFEGSCSCAMAYNCKHVAAVLLEACSEEDDLTAAIARPIQQAHAEALPYDITAWLAKIESARHASQEDYPDDEPTRVIYLLSTSDAAGDAALRLIVRPVSARLRSDGTLPSRANNLSFGYQVPQFARPSDRSILRRLDGGWSDGQHEIRREEASDVLKRMLATGRARWQTLNGVCLTEGPPLPARLVWRINPNGSQRVAIECGVQPLRTVPAWYINPKTGVMGPLIFDADPLLAGVMLEAPEISPSLVARVGDQLSQKLKGTAIPLPTSLSAPETLKGRPTPCLRFVPARLPQRGYNYGKTVLTGVAELAFRYGPVSVPAGQHRQTVAAMHDGKLYSVQRNKTAEAEAERQLRSYGLKRASPIFSYPSPGDESRLILDEGDEMGWLALLQDGVPSLRAKGWEIEIDLEFPHRFAQYDGDIEAELTEGSGIDWFDLNVGVEIDGEHVDLVPPLLGFLARIDGEIGNSKTLLVPLTDGRKLAMPSEKLLPLLSALAALFRSRAIEGDGAALRFSRMDAADLASLEAATASRGVVWKGGESLRALGARLCRADGVEPAVVPATFGTSLRPYQQRGVDWLQLLREIGFSGVLADDMGLGKTVQTLAHLLIEKESGRMDHRALIVCPTSLVPNWLAEANRFAPSLSVLALHGRERRTRFDEISKHDIVITTYPLLPRDHEVLTRQPWHIAVLDEAQMVKNPDALTAKLAARIDAKQRLCLSGTPLENHLGEALFSAT